MNILNTFKNQLTQATKLYFLGLIIFSFGLFLPANDMTKQIISILAVLLSGYHIMWEGIKDTIDKTRQNHCFTPNTHILMTMAALGVILLGEITEAALLIFIFSGAHFLEEYVENKSKREITKLLALNPTEARRLNANGHVELVTVEKLSIGDIVQVLTGSQIPIDGVIIKGQASIDESNINGESIPHEKQVGDEVYGATMSLNGTFIMQVTKESSNTVFSKIVQLVESARDKLSPTASRIRVFEPHYVNLVLLIFISLLLTGPSLFNWSLDETLKLALTFIVSASPCALAVSTVPATLSAITNLAKQGVLFKGGSFITNLADLKAIAFDKTGTLTQGQPRVVSYQLEQTIFSETILISLIVTMEKQANHPLATAIVNHFDNTKDIVGLDVTNTIGQGLSAHYQGKIIRLAKPSSFNLVSSPWSSSQKSEEKKGRTVIFVAIDEIIVGFIALQDVPQASAKSTIDYFKSVNIKTIMITGDAKLTGQAIGQKLGIDQVHANIMPAQKAQLIRQIQNTYGLVAMLGDGVNDAPALVTADIGIAMGEGTDIAIETADIVLMKNDLEKLVKAHKISQRLKKIILQNIIFSMLVVISLIFLTFWGELSVLASVSLHEGATLLVLINSLKLLKYKNF